MVKRAAPRGKVPNTQLPLRACAQYACSTASLSTGSRPGPPCMRDSAWTAAAPVGAQGERSCRVAPAQRRWRCARCRVSDELRQQATAASRTAAMQRMAQQTARQTKRPRAAAGSTQMAPAAAASQQPRRPRHHAARWRGALQRRAPQWEAAGRDRAASRPPLMRRRAALGLAGPGHAQAVEGGAFHAC